MTLCTFLHDTLYLLTRHLVHRTKSVFLHYLWLFCALWSDDYDVKANQTKLLYFCGTNELFWRFSDYLTLKCFKQTWTYKKYSLGIGSVVARPVLVVGNRSNFVGSLPRARGSTKLFVFNYTCRSLLLKWGKISKLFLLRGHAISRIIFWLCSFSVTLAVSQIIAKRTLFKICAGRHNVFLSECWAKIVSPGQARPAPPSVATTLRGLSCVKTENRLPVYRANSRIPTFVDSLLTPRTVLERNKTESVLIATSLAKIRKSNTSLSIYHYQYITITRP